MDKLVHELVKFVNSREGQEIRCEGWLLSHAQQWRPNARGPEIGPRRGVRVAPVSFPRAFRQHDTAFCNSRATLLVDRWIPIALPLRHRGGRRGTGIFVFILSQILPLFRGAQVNSSRCAASATTYAVLGVDEWTHCRSWCRRWTLSFVDLTGTRGVHDGCPGSRRRRLFPLLLRSGTPGVLFGTSDGACDRQDRV